MFLSKLDMEDFYTVKKNISLVFEEETVISKVDKTNTEFLLTMEAITLHQQEHGKHMLHVTRLKTM